MQQTGTYYSTNVLLIKCESDSSFIKQRAIIPVKVTGNKDIRHLGTWARSLHLGSLIPDFAPHRTPIKIKGIESIKVKYIQFILLIKVAIGERAKNAPSRTQGCGKNAASSTKTKVEK